MLPPGASSLTPIISVTDCTGCGYHACSLFRIQFGFLHVLPPFILLVPRHIGTWELVDSTNEVTSQETCDVTSTVASNMMCHRVGELTESRYVELELEHRMSVHGASSGVGP